MKKIISILAITTITLFANVKEFNDRNIIGTWEMSPLKSYSVTFGDTNVGDGILSLDFKRGGKVEVLNNNIVYYYQVINNQLHISKYPPTRKGKMLQDDIIIITGVLNSCNKAKYIKKGIAGVYNKNDFTFCKMKNEPIYTRSYDKEY